MFLIEKRLKTIILSRLQACKTDGWLTNGFEESFLFTEIVVLLLLFNKIIFFKDYNPNRIYKVHSGQ